MRVKWSLGSRVNDEILRLVPNVQVYRDSLRCIKLWAQRASIFFFVYVTHSGPRESYLLKRERILRWCRMGHTRCSSMPIISECDCRGNSQQILYHHVPMVRRIAFRPSKYYNKETGPGHSPCF